MGVELTVNGKLEKQDEYPALGTLKWLQCRHLRPHKVYLRRDVGLALFYNPKVGTKTFRSILHEGLQHIGAKPRVPFYYPINRQRRYVFSPIADYLHFARHTNHYDCYAFVRNPYKRFLSAWKEKFSRAHTLDKVGRNVGQLLPQLRRFALKHGLPGSEEKSAVPFETFLIWTESQQEGQRDHHWDTQRAVLHLDKIKYRRLFRMETEYTEGLMEVLTRAGIPESLIAERSGRTRNATPPLADPVYNEEFADRIYKIYEYDFERLGYEKDSWRGVV